MEITILQNEYWYGGCVKNGTKMPLSAESDMVVDTTINMTPNQATPLFVSTKGRYIWNDQGYRAEFRNGTIHVPDSCEVSEPLGNLRLGYLEAMKRHFPFRGETPALELFERPIYNSWIELTYYQNQKDILKYAKGIVENGMPSGVLMIDDGWSEYYGDWTFHSGKFPNAKEMLNELHAMGFQVMVWVCPFIVADSLKFREARDLDILIKNEADDPYIVYWWNGYSAVLDMSNPKAVNWLKKQFDALQELGVDGFKFDAGDSMHYVEKNKTYADTSANEQSHCWAEFGKNYKYNEFRVTFAAGGEPILQRLCDKRHSWDAEGVGGLLPDALLQGITGHPYSCPDMIGGGEYLNFQSVMDGKLDEELFLRHCQIATLMPAMQFSAAPFRVLSKEGFANILKCISLREKYISYIMDCVKEAGDTGEPILRYMAYEFPDEPVEKILDQFMLGNKYLVAPIVVKGVTGKNVYLPKGKWLRAGEEINSNGEYIWCEETDDMLILFEKVG